MYKLLSHNDLDGVSCGILAKLAFDNKVDVRYNSVSSLDRDVEYFLEQNDKNTFLIITDLSVNEENEKKLDTFHKEGGKVRLIDHHKTALHLNKYDWAEITIEDGEGKLTSATSLFYEYLVNQKLLEPNEATTEYVELVRQYDTWEWEKNENEQARRLNALFFLISIDEFEAKMIERLKTGGHFFFDDFEKKILDMEENKIDRYIRKKRRELVQTKIGPHFAGVVHAESYHSELGNELGKDCPHLDYIAILNVGGKRLGFRTIHDHVDVAAVAQKFGGGGHQKASGAILTEEAFKKFVQGTFHMNPLPEDARQNRYNVKNSSFGTLYQDGEKNLFFLFPEKENIWKVEKNKKDLGKIFSSFQEGENYLKRTFAAYLARDDIFVNFLMSQVKKTP